MAETKSINIRIGKDTHQRLLSYGQMGDTFDTLINKLLDEVDNCRKGNNKK